MLPPFRVPVLTRKGISTTHLGKHDNESSLAAFLRGSSFNLYTYRTLHVFSLRCRRQPCKEVEHMSVTGM